MGIWHDRIIDCQEVRRNSQEENFPSVFSKTINLDKGGKLALLSVPYTSGLLRQVQLKSKENIYLAIDGKINISDHSFNVFDYIINLYQIYGSKGLYKLDGAFSLILYDAKKQTTLLFRSFLTGFPLYFVAKNNLLSVSTNPVHLLHRSDVSDTLDAKQMSLIFSFSFTSWSGSVFSDLTELKHGEMVIITPHKIQHKERPLNEIFIQEHYGSESEAIEKYRYLVEKAVKESLLPEVKHGIMLSSGMDSSTLAAFASKILHQQDRELTAYSWMFPNDPLGDESEKIKDLCKMIKIPLKLFNGESFGPFDTLDNLLLLPDTPYTNPFWSISAELYRRASDDGVGALLNGGYADTLFNGNKNLLVDILKDRKFELFFPEVKSIVKQMGYCDALIKSPVIRGLLKYYFPLSSFKKMIHHAPKWLSDDAKENENLIYLEHMESVKEKKFEHFSTALSAFQAGNLGIDRYLSGIYDIKRITPHRNIRLINYFLGFPAYMVYRDGQTKYFAREAMRGLLPESIRIQPRVGNLNPFVQNSYTRNKKKVREMLLDDRSVWRQYVNETWMEDKLNSTDTLIYADFLVMWLSLNIQQWHKAIKPGGSLYEGNFTHNLNAR